MENIYIKALDLAGYELEKGIPLEIQFKNLFIDCVDGGMYSDITCEEEVDDLIEEIGLGRMARNMVRKLEKYGDFKRMVGIG
jgi:hypothetical protein